MRNQSFAKGAAWSLFVWFISVLNDVIVKKTGLALGDINVLFFRFFFGVLTLLPFLLLKRKRLSFEKTPVHFLRGSMFAVAMLPWCYSLIKLPLPLVTCIGFTTPLFVTILAHFFLAERLTFPRLSATILGFLGIAFSVGFSFSGANAQILLALLATLLFALLDVINKKIVSGPESRLSMMIMPTFWSCMCVLPLVYFSWQTPTWSELSVLFLLGLGSNLMFYGLLESFSYYQVSALQPFRYSEFIFSCLASLVFLGTPPSSNLFLGLLFIIPATLYLSYSEITKKGKKSVIRATL